MSPRNPQSVLVLLAGLAAAVTAILTGCSDHKSYGPAGPPIPPSRTQGQAVPVTATQAVRKDIPVEWPAIGTARAYASVAIKARVDGQLARVAFKPGDEVKPGDLLLQIDPRPFQAILDQAQAVLARDQAALANAELDMRRTDELADTKAVPQTVVDGNRAKVASLRASIAADQAAVASAELQLSFCSIVSPIHGRLGLLEVDPGNMVKNNDTILAVVNQTRPIYVDFSIPEKYLSEVRRAAARGCVKVEALANGESEPPAHGHLSVINNEVDRSTGTLLLRAEFPNEEERVWPGQFLQVKLVLGQISQAVVVPSQAVQSSQQGEFVFAIKPDATVEKRFVKLGPARGNDAVIAEGLQAGETVVTDGQLRLVPGAKVEVRATASDVTPAAAAASGTPR